jgi:mRNA-degrading endonuclease RelE of RelBE toxin-antitoxin system
MITINYYRTGRVESVRAYDAAVQPMTSRSYACVGEIEKNREVLTLWIKRRAQKELSQLRKSICNYETGFIILLEILTSWIIKLTARERSAYFGGEYRVIYEINDQANEITIFLSHRRTIYK